jgi:hypothetical protein
LSIPNQVILCATPADLEPPCGTLEAVPAHTTTLESLNSEVYPVLSIPLHSHARPICMPLWLCEISGRQAQQGMRKPPRRTADLHPPPPGRTWGVRDFWWGWRGGRFGECHSHGVSDPSWLPPSVWWRFSAGGWVSEPLDLGGMVHRHISSTAVHSQWPSLGCALWRKPSQGRQLHSQSPVR